MSSSIEFKIHPEASKPVLACAAVLLIAFFLPWVQLFGLGLSGYSLGRMGSYGNYAWIIPVLATITIAVTLTGQKNRFLGFVTGLVPVGVLLYALVRISSQARGEMGEVFEMAGHVLSIGAWLTIGASLGCLVTSLARSGVAAPRTANADSWERA